MTAPATGTGHVPPASDPQHDGHDDGHDDAHAATPADPTRPWWRRIDRSVLLMTFVVAIGVTLIVRGVLVGVTGEERSDLPAQIERVDPVPEAVRVLRQTSVFVDLVPGYTGRLIVDDVEIETVRIDEIGDGQVEPGQQIALPPKTIYEPGNATLTFTPTAGAPIERFEEGLHEATVIFWRIDDGPSRARSYSWTFTTD